MSLVKNCRKAILTWRYNCPIIIFAILEILPRSKNIHCSVSKPYGRTRSELQLFIFSCSLFSRRAEIRYMILWRLDQDISCTFSSLKLMIRRDSPWMMLIPVTNNRGGNEDSEQIFPLRPSRLECKFEAMTSAAGKNETSHHPSDLLSSKIGCSNEISVLHWKQILCWSHLGCIRTKFLKSWFHVIDDYRLKFFLLLVCLEVQPRIL